ncbi:heat shock 70 kDa protein 12A-like [Stylophora pistillata]|uniref:heat shock 70 kDa protein 12A-like n=1 Tax=Stylophora pistillata TaxID=50429 RepID=UPI000C04AA27|nr:heat shock 70 kDa protein 12A-like [Stylophora pistillata]
MALSLTDIGHSLLHLEKSFLATVAIDFGTTYSGFAFSFNKDDGEDAIFMNRDWENEQGHRTSKTPTCLLLKPDLSFDSFGYKAEEKYANLNNLSEEKEYMFFRHFKMLLHNDESLNLNTKIAAANGKLFHAKQVFAHSIRFLKEQALNIIRQETRDDGYKMGDIQWVLTVPAIWTPRAKQFMRQAAYEAGLGSSENPEQLIIALEPEAAALFCTEKYLERMGVVSFEGQLSQPNVHYMVVDIGGGTLDVTAHEKQIDGTIKEIYKVTGGPYGGVKVNEQFKSLLDQIFGQQKMYDYRQQFPSDWLKLMSDFEIKKRGVRVVQQKETRIRLPRSFVSWVNDAVTVALKRYANGEIRILNNEYLCLSSRVMVRQFQPVLEAMKDHLRLLLTEPRLSKVSVMLLVGGFANSLILQDEITTEFSRRCSVVIPNDTSAAVVQGAVLFGKNPGRIIQRVVCKTYGADCCREFVRDVHPDGKKFVANGVEMCSDLLNCFVKENEVVRLGQQVKSIYRPLYPDEKLVKYSFYAADNPNALLVTEAGVKRIGSVVVESPETWRGLERELEVSLYFGGTEITATARDISSGNTAQTTLDFFHTK